MIKETIPKSLLTINTFEVSVNFISKSLIGEKIAIRDHIVDRVMDNSKALNEFSEKKPIFLASVSEKGLNSISEFAFEECKSEEKEKIESLI